MKNKKELIKIKDNWKNHQDNLDFINDFERLTLSEKALIFDMLVEERDISSFEKIEVMEEDEIFFLNWTKKERERKMKEEEIKEEENIKRLIEIYKELGVRFIK